MSARKYLVYTLFLFAIVAMMFAIVVSMQGETVLADETYIYNTYNIT